MKGFAFFEAAPIYGEFDPKFHSIKTKEGGIYDLSYAVALFPAATRSHFQVFSFGPVVSRGLPGQTFGEPCNVILVNGVRVFEGRLYEVDSYRKKIEKMFEEYANETPAPARLDKVSELLYSMLESDPSLYGKILDTDNFAHCFNEIVRMAEGK